MKVIGVLLVALSMGAQPRKMTTEEQLKISKAAAAVYRAQALLSSKVAGCPTYQEIQNSNKEVELWSKAYQEVLDSVRAAAKAPKECEPDGDGGWSCKK